MYISTPTLKAVALDAASGRELWTFDPAAYNEGHAVIRLRNRGVTYWKGAQGERIFDFVKDRVYALNARTGRLIQSFGKHGYIDLREDLGVDPATVSLEMTSPGAVYKDLLILGSRVNESYDASPGHIRAYDAVTGRLRWIFHTIPQRGEFGFDTWTRVEGGELRRCERVGRHPFPLKPRPLVRQSLTEADLTNISPAAHAYALREFARYRSGPIFTPPTLQGTLTQPGHLGGSEWHGAAFDPGLNVLYVNVNDAPTINRLRPIHSPPAGAGATPAQLGRWIYERTCASCHGGDRQGSPPLTPSLRNVAIGKRASRRRFSRGATACRRSGSSRPTS